MKLIVGLGNPGPRYETTRHNVGFLAVDRLVDHWGAFGPKTQFESETYTCERFGQKIVLAKPQTFMNRSGRAVGAFFQFFKCKPEDLIVLHDEVDIKFNTFRIKTGGGTAGHNGIRSIHQAVGELNLNYQRLRIGIGRPDLLPSGKPSKPVEDHVLEPFADIELETLDRLFDDITVAVELMVQGKTNEAMNRFNGQKENV